RGHYDLGGLELPEGSNTARYELRVEPVRPEYVGTTSVGPYHVQQVRMSGGAKPITLAVSLGSDINQDIVMEGSSEEEGDNAPHQFSSPATLHGGAWSGNLANYGESEYYSFTARSG